MKIGTRLRSWLGAGRTDPLQAPLLDQREIAVLLARGRTLDTLAGAPASEFAAGDIPTRRPGSGMEFDDNRLYQVGDDARYINWRLTARTGTPYVKIFREERRPCAFVLLDRRANMRFATAGHLKVRQAAAAALLYAAAAVQRGTPVGGLVLDPQPRWLEPRHGETALRALLEVAVAPAPPLEQASEPSLAEILSQLAVRLRASADVVLLSDFSDLDDDCLPHLVRLGNEHRVRALQLSDPAEFALPEAGLLELANARGGAVLAVDSQRQGLRNAFARLAQQRSRWQRQALTAAGILARGLSTVDDPFDPAWQLP